jgi:hypothetical protein
MEQSAMLEMEWKVTLERLLGSTVIDKQPVHRGYTPVRRDIVSLANGRTAFVKTAVDERTAGWIRREIHAYHHLPVPHVPQLLGFDSKGEQPLLVLEDLRHAHWPPPWSREDIELVLEAKAALASMPFDGLESVTTFQPEFGRWWHHVAADPEPFLQLGLVSKEWLEQHIDTLLQEADKAALEIEGEALLHFDLRSDNLCLLDGRAILIDWNCACLGNPQLDLASWMPSLAAEGGALPEEILPGWVAGGILIAGYFASQAGLPIIPNAPFVREVQQSQLREALPWIQRMLELAPLDGA